MIVCRRRAKPEGLAYLEATAKATADHSFGFAWGRPLWDHCQKGYGNSGEDKMRGSFDSALCAPLRMTVLVSAVELSRLREVP
jgi:hypothetical protein